MRLALTLVFCLLSAMAWGQGSQNKKSVRPGLEIGYTGAPGARDMIDQYKSLDPRYGWNVLKPYIHYIKLYEWQVMSNPDAEILSHVKDNNFYNLRANGVFQKIGEQAKVELEIGVLKPGLCFENLGKLNAVVDNHMELMSNLRWLGVWVSRLTADNPFGNCGLNPFQAGEAFARWERALTDRMRAEGLPAIEVGSSNPYPFEGLQGHKDFIDKIFYDNSTRGYPTLKYYYLDVDRRAIRDFSRFSSDVKELHEFCRLRGIKLGLIISGIDSRTQADDTNGYYFTEANELLCLYKSQGLLDIIDLLMFQSWSNDSNKKKTIPLNVPDYQAWTHMNFVYHSLMCITNQQECTIYPFR